MQGTSGVWRVDAAAVCRPFTGRTALLSRFGKVVATADRAGATLRVHAIHQDVRFKARPGRTTPPQHAD